jgi:hypothetical protein
MALATLSVNAGYLADNTQKKIIITGTLTVATASSSYPVGGITLDSVLLALPEATASAVHRCVLISHTGTGYIYQRIPSTGKMMILQVPPNGSLTTAAPLQEIPSNLNLQGIVNDTVDFSAEFKRNV